jgi:hypothetical protein
VSGSSDWKALVVPTGSLVRSEALSAERCTCGAVRTPLSESCPQCHSLATSPRPASYGAAAPSAQATRPAPGTHPASADSAPTRSGARSESSGHDFTRVPVHPPPATTMPHGHAESTAVPRPAVLQSPPSLTADLARPDPAFRHELVAFIQHGLAPPLSGERWQIQSVEGPQSLSAPDPDLAPGRGVRYRVRLKGSGDRAMHVALNYDPVAHRFGRVAVLGSSGHGSP